MLKTQIAAVIAAIALAVLPASAQQYNVPYGFPVTGSGPVVQQTSPSLVTPNLGTPSAGVLTNATGLPLTTGVTGVLPVANGGVGTRPAAGNLFATDYMTAAQIADGTSRADTMDVSVAVNSCIAAAVAQGKTCYLPAGKWKVSGAQLVVDYGSNVNSGGSFIGAGPDATTIDLTGNTASPNVIIEANGGTPAAPLSTTYGMVGNFNLLGSIAGPVIDFSKPDFSDYLNQMRYENITVQNFNTSSASICGNFYNSYSSIVSSVNCSTGAGPNGGNVGWNNYSTSFTTFTAFGGSNAGTMLAFPAGGTATGNAFVGWDCEVVSVCVSSTNPSAVQNTWLGGTWSWNWSASPGAAVSASTGSQSLIINPNANPSATGGSTTFLAAGANAYYSLLTGVGLANLSAANTWSAANNFSAGLQTGGAAAVSGAVDSQAGYYLQNAQLVIPGSATALSGFGSSPAVFSHNASRFWIVGGSGAASSAVVGLPASLNGWGCAGASTTPGLAVNMTASTTTSATFSIETFGGVASTFSGQTYFSCSPL